VKATDWTQVKPGTQVKLGTQVRMRKYQDTSVHSPQRGVFIGATSKGEPVVELDSGGVYAYGKNVWELIPTTYTLTLTGPTGDSESVEVSREALEGATSWRTPSLVFPKKAFDLCTALLAREEK